MAERTPKIRISTAITMKVYGRAKAMRTIAIILRQPASCKEGLLF
jgi:hypothetical protein